MCPSTGLDSSQKTRLSEVLKMSPVAANYDNVLGFVHIVESLRRRWPAVCFSVPMVIIRTQ